MNRLRYISFNSIDSCDNNIIVSVRFYLNNFDLNILKIVLSLVWWSPRTTLRVNKVTMFKRFRCNLLKTNKRFEGTWWDSVGRVTWTIINWSNWIYNRTVRKATKNIPNLLGMSCVSISQFNSGLGGDKHRKEWHAICYCNIRSSIFMKQHSRDCIKFWSRGYHQSRLKHLQVDIQNIFIMLWME